MKKNRQTKPSYAWLELYELESNPPANARPRASRKAGRPTRPIVRSNTTISLTDEERSLIKENQNALRLRLGEVTQGQTVGFAVRFLHEQLQARFGELPILPAEVTTWQELYNLLQHHE
jgi:hypothetical protein